MKGSRQSNGRSLADSRNEKAAEKATKKHEMISQSSNELSSKVLKDKDVVITSKSGQDQVPAMPESR